MLLFDPFTPFESWGGRTATRAAFMPAADVSVSQHDVVLTMDLPGLTAGDVEIEMLDGDLVVRGERKRPELPEDSRWVHAERGFGAFERRIKLPGGVDADAVTASMADGVLSLIVPKPDRMRPRTIAIGSAAERRELETTAA
jgi:HSP20 family protein